MEKQIKKITQLNLEKQAPGFNTSGVLHSEYNTEPFLIFGEFYMDRPVFGPHPHAGISVMTYVLPDSKGSFLNRDSRGDHSIIEPGGIHVTQTGSGIYHDELPEVTGTECHAFQIWINHADKDRLVDPKAFHLLSKEVPEWNTEDIHLRVIQGNYQTLTSPIELVTKTSLFDITLKPNTTIKLDTKEMAFIYTISGDIIVGDKEIGNKSIITFVHEGSSIIIKTREQSANFMLASGTPHNEPIVYGGQFVMTTQKQMQETRNRLQRGEMGILNRYK